MRIKYKRWTREEEQVLIEKYPDMDTGELAKQLGRKTKQLYDKANRLGLVKSKEYRAILKAKSARNLIKHGAKSRFKKGNKPFNKGKSWDDYMSEDGKKGAMKTTFKKGEVPYNLRPVGSTRRDHDGYVLIKVSDNPHKWELAHRALWKQHNGDIPDEAIVTFKDGNKLNITIENLELSSREEMMKNNGFFNYPIEVREAIWRLSRLKRTINKVAK